MDPSASAAQVVDALLTPAGRALVAALTPYDPARALALVESARRDPRWADAPEVVSAAATQARLRTRAADRFPGPPRWWTPEGLEQATRPAVAARHAERFRAAGILEVIDLGSGAGSDAVAMAQAGLRVLAVDRDPAALWALAATAADRGLPIEVLAGDVTTMPGAWQGPGTVAKAVGCFVDPARRGGGARRMSPEAWSPPWSWVRELAGRVPATGAKVAPGIDHAAIPGDAQAEWVSVGGDLVEAAVWWGPLRQGAARRTAVLLPGRNDDGLDDTGAPVSLDDADGVPQPEVGPVGRWLVEPDAAVIRSGLVSVLAAGISGRLLDPRIAYITGDTEPPRSDLGATFEVLDEVPFARRSMRAWLRGRGYGDVIVKKRGLEVVPEELRAALRLGGSGPTATLVLTRTDAGPLALLVRRA